MSVRAAYLAYGDAQEREQMDWNPESSRRARGFPIYAAIRSLGRSGIQAMIERCCAHARRFAEELQALGAEILNDVVLNQVLLRFESDEATDEVVRRVQASGEAWMGGTTWAGRKAIRISVSNWQTTEADVERTLGSFRAAIGAPLAPSR